MSKISISVVIPTYYRSNDLAELLTSILEQTVMPSEVIVVDDTPNNEIEAVCENYVVKFRRLGSELTYLKNSRERSIAIARNIGAKRTQGDIIMFFDSDVVIYPDYMENILGVFRNYPNALGVQGWTKYSKPKEHPLVKALEMILSVCGRDILVEDQCTCVFEKLPVLKMRYPLPLTRIINCQHLEGASMSYKHHVLEEFQFDENLKKYTWMEDMLFGFSVRKRYPNSLYITPYAKYIHKHSSEGRMESKELEKHKRICMRYVLTKLFGVKGAILLFQHYMGFIILEIINRIAERRSRHSNTFKKHATEPN